MPLVTLAGPLWTVAEVKPHLRITGSDHDTDIAQKLDAAQEWVLQYLDTSADPTWTPTTAPKGVKNAILILLTHWYEDRGDEIGRTSQDYTPSAAVWRELQNCLALYRPPTLA